MIYLDNSASTPLCAEAKGAMLQELEEWGNPSSMHRYGFEAKKRLEHARAQIAESIHAQPEEIFFTSGGTESDNIAVLGAARKRRREGNRILSTDSEHPAVEECLRKLEEEGFEVIRLKTAGGKLDENEIRASLNEKTILCAAMHTNNETGAVYDIASLSRMAKEVNPACAVFTDCVQGYLKSEIVPRRLGADLISLSSHKIHGPKGVGALYVKKGTKLLPCCYGGGQENGIRSGTENLPGIIAFGAAAEAGKKNLESGRANMERLRSRIFEALGKSARIRFNLPPISSCHLVSMQVEGWRSEVLLHTLSDRGICVSSGSACSSHKGKSPVLKHFGLTDAEADQTIRISLSRLNTMEEIEEFIRIMLDILQER